MRRSLAVGLITMLAVAACSPAESATTSTTAESTTTESPVVTSTTESSTTTAPAVTTTAAGLTTTTTPSTTTTLDTNTLASGSGCTPGSDQLPEGEWYGLWVALEEDVVEFDLACWFTGEAAVIASAEDGEESPPPNDYYVRNESDQVRFVPVTSDVPVVWYPDPGDPTTEAVTMYEFWREDVESSEFALAIWITIEGGVIVSIREQWVP